MNGFFIESYLGDWFGMKMDWFSERPHGVPEGSHGQWMELLTAMQNGEEYHSRRLAWDPQRRIVYSPKNTYSMNEVVEFGFLDGQAGAKVIRSMIEEVYDEKTRGV